MRFYIMLAAIVMCLPGARACDICGGAAAAGSLGILPQYQQHFIGLTYQLQSFTSTHPLEKGETTPQRSEDRFNSYTLWGRFYPTERVQVFAFVPYHYNYVVEPSATTVMQGIGDVRLLVNYMLVNTGEDKNNWRHMLLAGAGVKAPTGSNGFINTEGVMLSNMQPGTGSWDALVDANYTTTYKDWGLNVDVLYQRPGVNRRDYLYGDKVSSGLTAFYWRQAGRFSLLPQAGLRHQWSGTDKSSYKYNIDNPYSGGYQLYSTLGCGIYFQNLALSATGYLPVAQQYAQGLVRAHGRFEMQLQYLF